MAFFKRILNFKREFLAKLRDKRKAPRYPVGGLFPLKATINLTGRVGASGEGGYDWGGRIVNMSSNGVGLQLLRAATTVRGEESELKLSLEEHALTVPCMVAHFRTFSGYSLCGLQLKFPDFKKQKAFLQLVEAVSMGSSFKPAKGKRTASDHPGLVGDQYSADNKALLTVWRQPKGGEIDCFEMIVGAHLIRGGRTVPPLVVFRMTKPLKPEGSAEVAGEVRRLFRWVVPNLPKAVPADVKSLMEHAARAKGSSETASGLRPSSPPSEWQRPSASVKS
ncbi:MAG TPA: PilZ domain-containing protein [Candidatus Didemnitutus sp.]|nr:PilZ domain-containing protein [Candidatus Didemnitutus sp.]